MPHSDLLQVVIQHDANYSHDDFVIFGIEVLGKSERAARQFAARVVSRGRAMAHVESLDGGAALAIAVRQFLPRDGDDAPPIEADITNWRGRPLAIPVGIGFWLGLLAVTTVDGFVLWVAALCVRPNVGPDVGSLVDIGVTGAFGAAWLFVVVLGTVPTRRRKVWPRLVVTSAICTIIVSCAAYTEKHARAARFLAGCAGVPSTAFALSVAAVALDRPRIPGVRDED